MIAVSAPRFFYSKCPLIGNLSLSDIRQTRIFPSVEVETRLVVIARDTSDSCLTHIRPVMASRWWYSSASDMWTNGVGSSMFQMMICPFKVPPARSTGSVGCQVTSDTQSGTSMFKVGFFASKALLKGEKMLTTDWYSHHDTRSVLPYATAIFDPLQLHDTLVT